MKLDPQQRATVAEVTPGTIAAQAGLQAGDEIVRLQGQPMLSMADVQWVLHQIAPEGGQVDAVVRRAEDTHHLTLTMLPDWRLEGDLSWRVSTWGLRRMATGGLSLEGLPEAERQRLELPRPVRWARGSAPRSGSDPPCRPKSQTGRHRAGHRPPPR